MGQEIRRLGERGHGRCDARAGSPHRHHEIAARGAAAISQPRRLDEADRAREIHPAGLLRHSAQRPRICRAYVFHRQAGTGLAIGAAVLWRAFFRLADVERARAGCGGPVPGGLGGVARGRTDDALADGRRPSILYYRRLAAELAGAPQPDGHDRQFRLDRRFFGAMAGDWGSRRCSTLALSSTFWKPVTSPSAASEASASDRGRKAWLASGCAFAVALLLLGAMFWTLLEKNLVSTMTQQGWTRELYGISAALTKLRFGIGGSAIDQRLFATLEGGGLTSNPDPALGVRYPDNLRDAKLQQSALMQALTIDLPPPAPANAGGDYIGLVGFSGEDTGLGTYNYLAFRIFGVNIPALTYLYFVIVTASLVLYGVGHWRSVGAMAAVVAMTLALYVLVCADFVNFLGSSKLFGGPGLDLKDPRFLGTLAAVPVLHMIVMSTRPRYRLGPLDYIVVAVQAAIFAFALQIRSPVVWVVIALSAFWLLIGVLALRRGGSLRSLCDWRQSRSVLVPVTVLAVLFAAQLLAAATLHPVYRAQGDVPRHMFWQGLLSSLQLEPEWDKKYGASVNGATDDAMPAQVARIAIMKLPPEERQQYLNRDGATKRTALEKFSRIAFFDILWKDPKFVAHAYFIDKPERAWQSERQFFGGLFSGLPIWNALIPAAAVMVLVVLAAWNADAFATLLPTAGVIPLFIVVAWLPNWLVILNPMVMIDNFVWIVVFLVLSLVIAAAAAVRCLRYLQQPGSL